jgi:hypothetical protein
MSVNCHSSNPLFSVVCWQDNIALMHDLTRNHREHHTPWCELWFLSVSCNCAVMSIVLCAAVMYSMVRAMCSGDEPLVGVMHSGGALLV